MRQFNSVAAANWLGAVVALGACSMGVRTTAPPALPQGQSSPFSATLDYLREEFRDEPIPMTFRVLVGSVGHYVPHLGIDAHMVNVSQAGADSIRTVLHAKGLAETKTLEWGDCPTFKMMGGDRSACPDSSFANVAIGSPERVVVDAEDRTLLSRPLAPTEVIVPTIVTFMGPWGAHTRFQSLLLHQDTNGWTVLRTLSTRYDE